MSYRDIALARTTCHDVERRFADNAILSNTDLIGIIAEGEFSKMYNLPFEAFVGIQGDGGYDFTRSDGKTIDVKATERPNGNLVVPAASRKPLRADIYVLAIVNTTTETADFIGWATKEEVRLAPVKDSGYAYGPMYFIHRSRLHPMSELFD